MSFADTVINREFKSDRKRTEFMQFGQGAHTIRILQPQAKTYPTHFFKSTNTTIMCLEDECPICANNRNLWNQFDKEAKKQPGYNARQYRFYVNVFDKTPAKTCTKCGKEYKDLRNTICKCGEVLPTEATPINKVRVLNKGVQLRDELDSIDKAIQGADGTPIGLTNYDMVLMVSGTGTDTKTTPVPRTESNQPIELGERDLFDLDEVIIKLSPEEMLDVHRGVSLKDVFAARRTKEEVSFDPIASQADLNSVNDAVNKLFNQE